MLEVYLDEGEPIRSVPRSLRGDLSAAFRGARANFLVVAFSSDWRFSPGRSQEIVKALLDNELDVSYAQIESAHGHDSFLMVDPHYHEVMRAYLANIKV